MGISEKRVETYAFLRLYDHDLEAALQSMRLLRRYRRNDSKFSVLRDAVVTYCRPFTQSRGILCRSHKLNVSFYSQEQRDLHQELLALRNELFAHTDLERKNPRIVDWSTTDTKWFPMTFRGYDYDSLVKRAAEIVRLIEFVRRELKKQMDVHENYIHDALRGVGNT